MLIKKQLAIILGMLILALPLISAGVGLKWSQESVAVNEGKKACLTYSVYNPWPEESYVKIIVSDSLQEVLTSQESEEANVPSETSSSEAIPLKFCFTVPYIYQRSCLIGDYICEQSCEEEQKVYAGEVIVESIPNPIGTTGTGGSSTAMSVSAPLNVRVICTAHGKNFTPIYVLLALISLTVVLILIVKKYRKPKIEREKEKLRKLEGRIKKQEGKKHK